MSNDMDLRTSYKKFIQDLPQLLADKGPEQVYALYKAENYGSLRAGGFREEIERLASPVPHWCDQGFFRLAELYDGLQLNHGDDYFLALMNLNVSLRQSLLRHDQQFRDELLWHLFTVEGTPERSFTTVDKNTFRNTWQRELLEASAEGADSPGTSARCVPGIVSAGLRRLPRRVVLPHVCRAQTHRRRIRSTAGYAREPAGVAGGHDRHPSGQTAFGGASGGAS